MKALRLDIQPFSLRLANYLQLTKPRVVSLIVFCAVIGMFLAVPAGLPDFGIVAAATVGIALVAGAAAAVICLVEQKIDAHLRKVFGHDKITSYLHVLTDWRLRWNFENGRRAGGRILYVVIFNITGAFILLMACVNYVNLATARASRRAREICVRKVTGATQRGLVASRGHTIIFTGCVALADIGQAVIYFKIFEVMLNTRYF